MPDWRYNVLSTSEAFIDAEGAPPRDPFAASYPRRADRSRPPHTCPYTTIFHGARSHVPYRLPPLHSDPGDPYADVYSVDRSSNLTDTSSFARYEDCRSPVESIQSHTKERNHPSERLDSSVGVQIQKVPYASNVFFISTQTEAVQRDVNGANLFVVEGSESDALSSCTCDSFERCEFDCRDFEPFSDTCCCDPLSDGVCSRSPKEVESPENFCDTIVEEDRVSTRSDMDGLDLTLFEPAQSDPVGCEDNSADQNTNPVSAALCGILYALPDSCDTASSATSGATLGVPPSWEPFYCVLQQDRRTLTAYTSEELASFPGFYIDKASNNNGEYATRSLPRVRIDGGPQAGNPGVRLRCWAAPPSITEEEAEDEVEDDAVSLRALPVQGK
ncbi:uncharacterized protein LOC119830517 [Zerene cesonia]|uniref:uncharacterized protein LOC119830517 n=1 Tax=Zerene cesonia TaxID=33412 RepID=UPI0018E526C7|nr:uncharacterized protein LOC119830517 [Zerene cesonia]